MRTNDGYVPSPLAWLALAIVAALAITVIEPAGSARAHAGYDRSEPADGAVLAESPDVVEVYFSQEMRRSGGLPELIVVNDSGDVVDLGAKLDDDDRTHISAQLAPALPPGRYTVLWHTLSDADGEEARGAFHFYVGAGPSGASPAPATGGTPTATPAATEPPDGASDDGDGGIPAWELIAGIAGGLLAGGIGGVFAGRRLER